MAVASEIGTVRLHAYDWANLRTGHAGVWRPVPGGPPRKRNASKIGPVLTTSKIFV